MDPIRFQPTGLDDQPQLQALVDSLPAESIVRLSGQYRFGSTLRLGAASLCGDGYAKITYVGPSTDAYLIAANEASNMAAPRLRHLDLDGAFNTRGILLRLQRGMHPISHCHVRGMRQIGLDVVNCWGSELTHLHFRKCYGMAIRIVRSNTTELRHVTMTACANRDWPMVDDATVTDYGNIPVQTAENERGCVVIDTASKGLNLEHVRFETCVYDEKPLVFACGDCWNPRISRLYLESNQNTQCRILLRGRDHDASESYMLEIDGVYAQDQECPTFLRLEGRTSQVLVRDYIGKGNRAIVTCAGGIHQDVRCERVRTWEPHLVESQWIVDDGAVIRREANIDSLIV